MKSDEKQLTPESLSVPGIQPPPGYPVMQSGWPGPAETQWLGPSAIVSITQQSATAGNASAPAVSLSPGSVLPVNLLPAELSSLLGMAQGSAGLSSSNLPLSVLLPGGLIVSADSGNVKDPLASLSKLSTGVSSVVSGPNTNNNIVTTEARNVSENLNKPSALGVKVEPETGYLCDSNRHANAAAEVGNRLPISVPGGLGSVNTTVNVHHPQKVATVGPQLPLVTGIPQSTSAYFPALHQLLQPGTATGRSMPAAPPAYTKVKSENIIGAESKTSAVTAAPAYSRRRWISADSGVVNRQIHWGYDDHSDDITSNMIQEESSGFDISKNSLSPADGHSQDPMQNASTDKDLAEFSAPSGLALHHKFRRKHRPQPLIIPSPVSHFGFQSRLRSPRISDQPGPGLSSETSLSVAGPVSLPAMGLTPYTPPPMLSPRRTGSGLFCSLLQPSPKSAPVGFRLGLHRHSK